VRIAVCMLSVCAVHVLRCATGALPAFHAALPHRYNPYCSAAAAAAAAAHGAYLPVLYCRSDDADDMHYGIRMCVGGAPAPV
jgi:hypothetical protein